MRKVLTTFCTPKLSIRSVLNFIKQQYDPPCETPSLNTSLFNIFAFSMRNHTNGQSENLIPNTSKHMSTG